MRNNPKVGIFFLGKYTNAIGPPKSMQDLADLLSHDFDVERGNNLKLAKHDGESLVSPHDNRRTSLLFRLKSRLKQSSICYNAVIFWHVVKFNCEVFYFAFKYPSAKIIITHSSLIYSSFFPNPERVIYIRRGNSEIRQFSRLESPSFVKRMANNSFVKYSKIKKVYLVDNGKLPYDYSVIPNFFDANNFDVCFSTTRKIALSYIGTWCERKGASLYLKLVTQVKNNDSFIADVYGVLGNDDLLNDELLNNQDINYRGLVSKPSSYMHVGDIFISFSSLEGLQRSLVESMLTGCIVIGLERPDTLSLVECPGVFIFKNDNNLMENVASVLQALSEMAVEERQNLGLTCRDFASNVFSKSSVLSSWKKVLNA